MTKETAGLARFVFSVSALALGTTLIDTDFAAADEGGVGFWVTGFASSLAATPQVPGFSFANVLYYSQLTGGGDVAFARQVNRGNITTNFSGNLSASIKGNAEPLYLAIPGYTFATPVLGGQASVILGIPYGRIRGNVDATLTGSLGPIGFTKGGSLTETATGFGDLISQFSLRWNQGVNNYMVYVLNNYTVGDYDAQRIANLGIGHYAVDVGGAYTYFDQKAGHEFSATLGFTYNFENPYTHYQNGIDMHIDWGASQFVTKQLQVGLAGYWYQQISCDSGAGNRLGCFETRVAGVGPQIGYVFPVSKEWQGYINLKGFKEFAAEHRPEGWNGWLTIAFSPAPPGETPPSSANRRMVTK